MIWCLFSCFSQILSIHEHLRFRHWAKGTFRKTCRFAFEHPVKSSPEVFLRNGGSQFHQLSIGETSMQFIEQFIADHWRRIGHGNGKIQNQLFCISEEVTVAVIGKVHKLFFRHTIFPANGRAGIQSGRAADNHARLYLGKPANAALNQA